MKKTLLLLLIIVPVVLSIINAGECRTATVALTGVYNSNASYQGVYAKDRIYRKRAGSELWIGSTKPAKIFTVKCASAAQSLSSYGTWVGNLRTDGSCGSKAEPGEWAVGNYLNFIAVPDTDL